MSRSPSPKSQDFLKRADSLQCTCEIGKLKNVSKEPLRYSICDICSDKFFTSVLHSSDHSEEKY
jgi:hypothetical protein